MDTSRSADMGRLALWVSLTLLVSGGAFLACTPKGFHDDCVGENCGSSSDAGEPVDGDGGVSCAGCLDGPEGKCLEGTADDACGSGGAVCKACEPGRVCSDEGTCVESPCNAENCKGCCRAGTCRAGTKDFACGSGGEICASCADEETCTAGGDCVECRGCWDEDGYCRQGITDDFCGTGGVSCTTCGTEETCQAGDCTKEEQEPCSESCIGCCRDGTCAQGSSTEACGRGGEACATCANGFACQSGDCVLPPSSQWNVVAIEATIVQSSVDVDTGSAPDPRLEVTVGENSGQTSNLSDTYLAQWNEIAITASAGGIRNNFSYRIMDKDRLTDDDEIVSGCTPSFTVDDFKNSQVRHTCVGGSSAGARATVRFRLSPE